MLQAQFVLAKNILATCSQLWFSDSVNHCELLDSYVVIAFFNAFIELLVWDLKNIVKWIINHLIFTPPKTLEICWIFSTVGVNLTDLLLISNGKISAYPANPIMSITIKSQKFHSVPKQESYQHLGLYIEKLVNS